jgi:hypothetical protein
MWWNASRNRHLDKYKDDPCGPQTRNLMHKMQFGDLLEYAGGARRVLGQALARLRKREA